MPIESSVKGLPVGPITAAPLRTQRPANGMSAVMTISLAPACSAIQSSATSGPSLTMIRSIMSLRGTAMKALATT
jgi:hypothetical protein